jgi:antitoxin component YwqK of YwqJK toxin-antitoxin module
LGHISEKGAAMSKPIKKLHKIFHNDGSLWGKGYFVNGVEEGNWVWFRKDGTKLRSGTFLHGKQTGKWTTYDKLGKPFKVTDLSGKNSKSKPKK